MCAGRVKWANDYETVYQEKGELWIAEKEDDQPKEAESDEEMRAVE